MSQAQLQDRVADPMADHSAIAGGVRFRRLALTDFRSYGQTTLALDGRPVVLAGANGAGKTNILEALSLIGPGRGLRRARLDELPRIGGAGGWAVAARLCDADMADEQDGAMLGVGAHAEQPDRRQCRIDGKAASGPSAFSRHVRFLWLTPAQDRLFMDGAAERRRFLDRMALAHDPAHGQAANAYEKAMRQRQRLLEDGGRDEAWLSALEAQMAEAGVAVAAARREMVATLAGGEIGDAGDVFPKADIALEGALEAALAERPAADVEDDYIERLKYQRRADREAGRALLGPHRSDMLVAHRGKDRPARLCSTGEQKGLLIGLVLANAQALSAGALSDEGRARLVLLMDEIAAHLDEDRRAALFDILDGLGFQCFMTGTDLSLFSAWGPRAQGFRVAEGEVSQLDL